MQYQMQKSKGADQNVMGEEFNILVTEEDRTGDDLLAMSDFFGNYISRMSMSLCRQSETEPVMATPFSDIGIIGEVIKCASTLLHGTTQLLPDFSHIPEDIKKKLNEGVYKIGESRQVDGNMRAVIVDEEGTRVKDITLKEVKLNVDVLESVNRIANQLQLRQISNKVDEIKELQAFQIERDRDRDIKVPFLDARFYILKAQGTNCTSSERKEYIEKASEILLSAVNNVYTEMTTSTDQLVRLTHFPIFQNRRQIDRCIGYLTEDLQVSTRLVGLRLQLLDYLGDLDGAKIEMQRYRRVMNDFFVKKIPEKTCSVSELIHMNFPYNSENRNCWYQLSTEVKPTLTAIDEEFEHVYLVSVEDLDDGQ